MTDFLDLLFTAPTTEAERLAGLEAVGAAEAARIAAVAPSAPATHVARCSRCAGSGRIAQFMHRAAGVCFSCGGSGVAS